MRRAVAACAVVLLAAAACARERGGAFEAYREGRFREASGAFQAAARGEGGDAAATLTYDAALASLRAGDLDRAGTFASQAATRGDAATAARASVVLGHVAWARSLAAEAEALRPGASPRAAIEAVTSTEDALASWRLAAASRDDWPAARRNVERALVRLERLRERGSAGGGGRPKEAPPDVPKPPDSAAPTPPPPPPPAPATEPAAPADAAPVRDLSADEVRRLLDVLAEKEREKAALRRRRGNAPSEGPERDW